MPGRARDILGLLVGLLAYAPVGGFALARMDSNKVSEIFTGVIDGFAGQTRILALDGVVESARPGQKRLSMDRRGYADWGLPILAGCR